MVPSCSQRFSTANHVSTGDYVCFCPPQFVLVLLRFYSACIYCTVRQESSRAWMRLSSNASRSRGKLQPAASQPASKPASQSASKPRQSVLWVAVFCLCWLVEFNDVLMLCCFLLLGTYLDLRSATIHWWCVSHMSRLASTYTCVDGHHCYCFVKIILRLLLLLLIIMILTTIITATTTAATITATTVTNTTYSYYY